MHRKQADMKAMLAKGFKKEKNLQKQREDIALERGYKLDDKHEHYEAVKTRKKELDSKFNIKMAAENKKTNERQNIVLQNRMNQTAARRNITVDNALAGSNSQLDYPMGGTMNSQQKLNYQSKLRMQSATTRALNTISDSEHI